ncbi:MAG: flagellar basal body rod protein FlgC [Deltaproteobacteria bacterium]|nr:flagellar basal body rod protein FlgC [Deltaproteobacteria bacterium]
MGFYNVMAIGSSGMRAQRVRMEVLSSNLSNINTTRSADGRPYQRMVPVFRAQEVGSEFATVLQDERKLYEVMVDEVKTDDREPIQVYEPDHPDADENGYVYYPNISTAEEMVSIMSATRGYEANLTAVNAAKEMAKRAIELAR